MPPPGKGKAEKLGPKNEGLRDSQVQNKMGTKYSGKLADFMKKKNAPKKESDLDKSIRRRIEAGINVVSPQDAAAVIGRYVGTDDARDRFGSKNKAAEAYSGLVQQQQQRLEDRFPDGPRQFIESKGIFGRPLGTGKVTPAGANFMQRVFNEAAGFNPTRGMGIMDSLRSNYEQSGTKFNRNQAIRGILGSLIGGPLGGILLGNMPVPGEERPEGINEFGMPIFDGRQIDEYRTFGSAPVFDEGFQFSGMDAPIKLAGENKNLTLSGEEASPELERALGQYTESDFQDVGKNSTVATLIENKDPYMMDLVDSFAKANPELSNEEAEVLAAQGYIQNMLPSGGLMMTDLDKSFPVREELKDFDPTDMFNQLRSQPLSQYNLNDFDAAQDALNQAALAGQMSLADMGFEGRMQESPFPGQALTNQEDIDFRNQFMAQQAAAEDKLGFRMDDLVDLRNINYDATVPSTGMGYFSPETNKMSMGMTFPGTFNVNLDKTQPAYSPFDTVLHEGMHSLFKESVPSGIEEFTNRQITTSAFPPGSPADLSSMDQFSGYDLNDPGLLYGPQDETGAYNVGLSAGSLASNQQVFDSLRAAGFDPSSQFQDRFRQQPGANVGNLFN